VDDPFAVERLIHALLASRRVHPRREFFRTTADDARVLLALVVPDVSGEQVSYAPSTLEVPVAESAEELGDDQRGQTGDTGETGETEQRHTSHRDQSGQSEGVYAQDMLRDMLRAWVESKYTHITLCEKDAGEKLDKLHGEYARAGVHARALGRNTFAHMLRAVYPGIGPHMSSNGNVQGLYLLCIPHPVSAQDMLRAWVESKYAHITLREKDAGEKLDKLHGEYARAGVHARPLGRNKFAHMLRAVYPGIGPQLSSNGNVGGLYLLRACIPHPGAPISLAS
jgi:hypothetical protein